MASTVFIRSTLRCRTGTISEIEALDNYTHAGSPFEFNMEDARDLWNQIRCPMLLLWGTESWGNRPDHKLDLSPFHDIRAVAVADAGHWVHHDQFEVFMSHVGSFLDE